MGEYLKKPSHDKKTLVSQGEKIIEKFVTQLQTTPLDKDNSKIDAIATFWYYSVEFHHCY